MNRPSSSWTAVTVTPYLLCVRSCMRAGGLSLTQAASVSSRCVVCTVNSIGCRHILETATSNDLISLTDVLCSCIAVYAVTLSVGSRQRLPSAHSRRPRHQLNCYELRRPLICCSSPKAWNHAAAVKHTCDPVAVGGSSFKNAIFIFIHHIRVVRGD